ncbi:MAG: hypothetical protein M3O28_13355, partial [Actinomycetota bacterium]|nr:hypothetical protein [Actinomycetota bacterium]
GVPGVSRAARAAGERGSGGGVDANESLSTKPAKVPREPKAPQEPKAPREIDPDSRDRRLRGLRWAPAVVAGLAVLAMLALGAWQSHGVWWGSRLHDSRAQVQQQVLAAAKPCTAAILSYDYRNIPAALAAGEKCVTGNLKTQYVQVMNQTVKVVAPQTKTVQTFQVAKAGISSVSADGKQWVVLVFGQETVTNSTTAAGSPRLDLSSAVVTLNKVNGQWVVSNLTNTGNGG